MIGSQLLSPAFNAMRVVDSISVGTGCLRQTAHRLTCTMPDKATAIGPSSRQRFAPICSSDSPDLVWKVPAGCVVNGVTIIPHSTSAPVLRTLSSSIVSTTDAGANGTPCGEIAFTLHRTSGDLYDDPHYPIGSYMVGDHMQHDRAGNVNTRVYNPSQQDQYQSYFRHFIVNCDGHAQSLTVNSDSNAGAWHSLIHYRQAASGQLLTGQAGAPVVYVAAEHALFRHGTVYVPFTQKAGLVSDGTWGLAIGFVSEATYHELTGATKWHALSLDIIVHTHSVA